MWILQYQTGNGLKATRGLYHSNGLLLYRIHIRDFCFVFCVYDAAAREAALAEREKRVDSLLRTAKAGDALKAALAEPPFASKNQALKDRSAACVLKAVVAVGAKDADLNAFLEALDADSADVLMKVRSEES